MKFLVKAVQKLQREQADTPIDRYHTRLAKIISFNSSNICMFL